MICGPIADCLTLIDGSWKTTTTLLEKRYTYLGNPATAFYRVIYAIINLIFRNGHSSWASPSGLMLLGGWASPKTSERIQGDGTSVSGFNLEYDLRSKNTR